MGLDIELQVISKGYDRKTCWVHARPGMIPGESPVFLMTAYKASVTGMDVFYAINDFRSDDGGKTWIGPTEHKTLDRRPTETPGGEVSICDFWPGWHKQSGRMLGIGHTVRYVDNKIPDRLETRSTAYSVYDPESRTWTEWKILEKPQAEMFFNEGAGSVQRFDLPNGDILLPTYCHAPDSYVTAPNEASLLLTGPSCQCVTMVMRCSFDGETLSYIEHGNEMTVGFGRGLCEPSLAFFNGRYFLTMRNDEHGYITSGEDGLHFEEPKIWTWDDGSDLGNYNTQQHWVTMPDALYLVYTRRGANNDHIFRHRAPLFIAQVDTERLCVIRETEQVLIPERGARLCNFGAVRVSETESWVGVTEWMQANAPNPCDCTVCERYGSDNSVYVAKIRRG